MKCFNFDKNWQTVIYAIYTLSRLYCSIDNHTIYTPDVYNEYSIQSKE